MEYGLSQSNLYCPCHMTKMSSIKHNIILVSETNLVGQSPLVFVCKIRDMGLIIPAFSLEILG